MQYKFIPVNNNLDKAIAFANTLDPNYIKNVQRIKQKEFYIPTIDVVQKLQKEGWMINGVDEQRNKKSRKITNNYIQMTHPDFAVKNKQGKDEAYSSITIVPAPSPITKPSLSLSNGRLAVLGSSFLSLSAFMALKPPIPLALMTASLPPVSTISALPKRITSNESIMALVLLAQADTTA